MASPKLVVGFRVQGLGLRVMCAESATRHLREPLRKGFIGFLRASLLHDLPAPTIDSF